MLIKVMNVISSQVPWLGTVKFRVCFCIALIVSVPAYATDDVLDSDDKLKYLRVLMSHPKIAGGILGFTEKGCVWTDEVIWFGSADAAGGQYVRLGGFSVLFKSDSGTETWLSYLYSINEENKLVTVNRDKDSMVNTNC